MKIAVIRMDAGHVTVRRAVADDAAGVVGVQVRTWQSAYRGIVPDAFLDAMDGELEERTARWAAHLARPDPTATFVVEYEGEVVGFARGGPSRDGEAVYPAELYAIYVLPKAQRHGLGRELVQSLAEHLGGHGYRAMKVWALAENKSRAFYERLGGHMLGSRRITIGGAVLDEVSYGYSLPLVAPQRDEAPG